jgi:quercetin dioxygenase-like cupin family protein
MAIIGKSKAIKAEQMKGGAVGATKRVLIAETDGADYSRMRYFTVSPGGYSPYHTHWGGHQVFIVKGRGELVADGAVYPFESGDYVFVNDTEQHQFKNTGDEDLEFICIVPSEKFKGEKT